MGKPYFPIFTDWLETTAPLTADEKGRLIDAIVLYMLGEDYAATLTGNERILFPTFKNIYERTQEVSEARAFARQNKTKNNKPEQKEQTQSKRTKPHNNNNNNNNNYNNNYNKDIGAKAPTASRFIAPTIDDICSYAQERGHTDRTECERFRDYYESNGWRVGKNPMKDWRAALRGWFSRNKAQGTSSGTTKQTTNPALNYEQRDNDYYEHYFDNYGGDF